MMIERIMFLIGGISCCGLGYLVITQGGWRDIKSGTFIIYGNMRTPVGVIFFISGLFLVIYAVTKKELKSFICPKCDEVVESNKMKNIECPGCHHKMEPLEGFYERHPDKK